jgi:hypothetical protein
LVAYIENRKILGSAKKKKIMRPYPNNNNDLADINIHRKRSDTLSVDEYNAIVSNELSQDDHSSVIEPE